MTKEQNEKLNDLMQSFIRSIELVTKNEREYKEVIKMYISTMAIATIDFELPQELNFLLITQFMLEASNQTFDILEDMYSENPTGETHTGTYNVEEFVKYKARRSTDKED